MLTESQRQEQYRRTVYAPAQDARKAYWQSMWERSMHNPKNKPEPVEMPGDLPYPENPKNTWTGDPWKGVRGTPEPTRCGETAPRNAPCCKFEGDPSECALTDKDLSILTEAHGLVHGDRQDAYGHPANDFSRTAALLNIVLAGKLKDELDASDVALAMICVKLSREVNKHGRDNLVDLCGYAETRQMVLDYFQKLHS